MDFHKAMQEKEKLRKKKLEEEKKKKDEKLKKKKKKMDEKLKKKKNKKPGKEKEKKKKSDNEKKDNMNKEIDMSKSSNFIQNKSALRIMREYKNTIKSDLCDIIAMDDMKSFWVRFTPKGGHYVGQTIIMQIITQRGNDVLYPFNPPGLRLLTPVWHTNISNYGSICVDFLYDKNKWSPAFSFTTLISQIILLFTEPEISSGHMNAIATKMFRDALEKNDFTEFDKKCLDYYHSKKNTKKTLEEFQKIYKTTFVDRPVKGL